MKWILTHQATEHHRWLLTEVQSPALLTYNPKNHSIRIKAKGARLFFLEPVGFLQKKILLRSEYGVVLGEAQWAEKSGQLLLDNQKFFYRWNDHDLFLYDKSKTLLLQTKVDYDAVGLEKFAFVFSMAWLYDSVVATEALLVA